MAMFACLIPLLLCFLAAYITLGSDRRTLDGIPGPLAAITGILCLIWFVAISPWPIKVALLLVVLGVGQRYLQDTVKLG